MPIQLTLLDPLQSRVYLRTFSIPPLGEASESRTFQQRTGLENQERCFGEAGTEKKG